uniref:Uncharacterized protein n=1 Tax=Chromera velia CCMP2878 TaxID=1169474 RepID=A0A0G4HLC2_9ALVE|eukprot:Cvel_28706.t1-p1 / transcript=Cvel_28706.t1 / gene=Cvel_28706 / organism=Chromera_velia_CCMP2878 / gene_product=hypothetical protein / transcript_product=hypothetical protein / location=Cvel_scaffold3809:9609-10557(-) / protein_length=234 / sequence_SO=supercontig / SO=protein_coding / is_pseudo=false
MASSFFSYFDFTDCAGLSRACSSFTEGTRDFVSSGRQRPAPADPPLEFRTRQQVGILVERWMTKLHPRAAAMSQDDIRAILDAVGSCVSRWEDPLDPKPHKCCMWHGEQTFTNGAPMPIMKIALNRQQQPTQQQEQQQEQQQQQTQQQAAQQPEGGGGGGDISSTASTVDEGETQPPVFSVDVRRVLAFCFAEDGVHDGIAQQTTQPLAECKSKICVSVAHFDKQVPFPHARAT